MTFLSRYSLLSALVVFAAGAQLPEVATAQSVNPICASSSSDPDGDGWGWENNRSCRVMATATHPTCNSPGSDPDGDGWGWENNRSCRVMATAIRPTCNSSSSDPDGDGWGWENNRSCRVGDTVVNTRPFCESASSDPDGDGWGWENNRSCIVNSPSASVPASANSGAVDNFNRIATFPICSQIDINCNDDTETVAEIVAASNDGLKLIYSNSENDTVGFVDISDPSAPVGLGETDVAGEPTSVAVAGHYVLVGLNTSEDFINVSGELVVLDVNTQTVVHSRQLNGQPDSVAVSPDQNYFAIVIENERDEDLGDGVPPQLPAGELIVGSISGTPDTWTTSIVSMTGLADLFPTDPEPEYVDINDRNVAVVTLQENNHIVLVDLPTASVIRDFTAGTVSLTQIDTEEEDPAIISLNSSEDDLPREPDGVAWITSELFATADEGDLDGGSRGFTVYNTHGDVVYTSASLLDHLAVKLGHYPDARSGNKGNEPENAEVGHFGDKPYLFVNSERSSLVFVFDVSSASNPTYVQTLPAAVGPEGVVAIPSRNLAVAASEVDARGDKIRSALNIYEYQMSTPAQYPSIESVNDNGLPIPWGAMSGLVAADNYTLYAVEDSFYSSNRIFTIDTSTEPAQITDAMPIRDTNGVMAAFEVAELADNSVDPDDPTRIDVFDSADLASILNADGTVNVDPEGIAVTSDGGFLVASEGNGTAGDSTRPINSRNFLIKTDARGVIENVITLPDSVNDIQLRFGFEGVAVYGHKAYVAMQRAWGDDDNPRIGIYDLNTGEWEFVFYPLDEVESQNGGWVGLSDLVSVGDGTFLVLERDNQGGPDAAIKRIYQIDLTNVTADTTVSKTLVRDLIHDLASFNGFIFEKVEGLAQSPDGTLYVINDNDGVDDNSGETQLMRLHP